MFGFWAGVFDFHLVVFDVRVDVLDFDAGVLDFGLVGFDLCAGMFDFGWSCLISAGRV